VSQRGDPYCRVSIPGGNEHCVTLFRRKGGWGWCLATDADHAPLWSPQTYDTMSDARANAFEALLVLATLKEA
jgi:hypothetical protein